MNDSSSATDAGLRVALVGGEAAGAQTLKFLLSADVDVALVCAAAEETAIGKLVAANDLRSFGPETIAAGGLATALHDERVDLLLNVHSLHILPKDVVAAPRIGSFNLHPGPLPEYGGLGAPSWAIYNGETRYAVTLHWMTAGLDDGDIAYQHWFELDEATTGLKVSTQCAKFGLGLCEQLVSQARHDAGQIPRTPQGNGERRLYRRSQIPGGGVIDWSQSAVQIARFVRAASYRPFASPWGDPQTTLAGEIVGIVSASVKESSTIDAPIGTVVSVADGAAAVVTGHGLLWLNRVNRDGRVVAAGDVLKAGQVLGSFGGGQADPS